MRKFQVRKFKSCTFSNSLKNYKFLPHYKLIELKFKHLFDRLLIIKIFRQKLASLNQSEFYWTFLITFDFVLRKLDI